MFCPGCGTQLPDDSQFCGNCGISLKEFTQNQTPVKKEKTPRSNKLFALFTKQRMVNLVLWAVLAVVYGWIFYFVSSMFSLEEGITVVNGYSESAAKTLTLEQVRAFFMNGNMIFHPTVLSTALGVGITVLHYGAFAFGGLAFVTACFTKRNMLLTVTSSIVFMLTAVLSFTMVPLSFRFVPLLKNGLAMDLGMILSDVKTVTCSPLVTRGIIMMVLAVVTVVLTAVLNKRRVQK